MFKRLTAALILLLPFSALAAGIQWEGRYLVEGNYFENPTLDSEGGSQLYGLHHLILRPEIVPADGFILRSRFDIFNNRAYPNSQLGQTFGSGPGVGRSAPVGTQDPSTVNSDQRNVLAGNQLAEQVAINELYLTWIHEYGSLIVGRVPLQFGLGASYSAGLGDFDHWFDNRDMIAYKVQLGNFYVMPMFAKISEGLIGEEDEVNDYMLQFEYANPETELALGALYRMRRSNTHANDMDVRPGVIGDGPANAARDLAFAEDQISVFFRQFVGPVKMGFEGQFVSGNFGLRDAAGQDISMSGMGLAFELEQEMPVWNWGLRAGYASGDDPATTDVYEGFAFDRNYDVAVLMYNRVLGASGYSPLRTQLNQALVAGTEATDQQYDVESISNSIYFAPRVGYTLNDQWKFGAAFIYGTLVNEPIPGSGKDLGYELDLAVSYLPNERVTWKTELGLLFPGDAFMGGPANNFENKFTYGFVTKAAINF